MCYIVYIPIFKSFTCKIFTKFKGKGLENWDVSNIEPTNMFDMFNNCQSLKKPSWYKGNI